MFLIPTHPSLIYAIIFTISFWCWLIFEIWVFSRDRRAVKTSSRARGNSLGVIIAIVIGITLGLNFPIIVPLLNIRNHFVIFFTLGITLLWIGILFRYWAIHTLGKFFRTKLDIQEHHELIMNGPYKYLRHPSYTGAMLTFIGLGFGIGNWLSIAVLITSGLTAYVFRIRVEERMLLKQFNKAYRDYKKKTWRLIPFIW
jgi:protein-S-isoprenylcysteine O-methyltransferase